MKPAPDHEELLTDVLAEDAPAYWRDSLLEETLRHAGRKRRVRHLRRGVAALAMVVVLGATLWRLLPTGLVPRAIEPAGYVTVRTQPLAADAIVRTRSFPVQLLVASQSGVTVVRTRDSVFPLRLLNDQELLAMVDSRSAVLVRRGPDTAELIFVNPENRKDTHFN